MDNELIEEAKRLGVLTHKCDRRELHIYDGAKTLRDEIDEFLATHQLQDAGIEAKHCYDNLCKVHIAGKVPKTEDELREAVEKYRQREAETKERKRQQYEALKREFEGETQ